MKNPSITSEKFGCLFCAIFINVILVLQPPPLRQPPAVPTRHTFRRGHHVGIHLDSSCQPRKHIRRNGNGLLQSFSQYTGHSPCPRSCRKEKLFRAIPFLHSIHISFMRIKS